jgi:hypothetical protein
MEQVKDLIMRQTDYTSEVAEEKLKEHKNDVVAIIREYMLQGTIAKKEVEVKKSVNQQIYNEIRNLMDDAALSYKQKKELEERNKIINERLIHMRDKAKKNMRTKIEGNVILEAEEEEAVVANANEVAVVAANEVAVVAANEVAVVAANEVAVVSANEVTVVAANANEVVANEVVEVANEVV